MASFKDSFRLGQSIADTGIQAYDRARAWSERLTEKQVAAEEKKYTRDRNATKDAEDRAKQRYLEFESGVKQDQAAGKESFDQSIETRKQAWAENPKNAANVRATGTRRKVVVGGKTFEMDENQLLNHVDKTRSNYHNALVAGNEAAAQDFGQQLVDLGEPSPAGKEDTAWWGNNAIGYKPPEPAAPPARKLRTGTIKGVKATEKYPGEWGP